METDNDFRNRVLRHVCEHSTQHLGTGWFNAVTLASDAELDRLALQLDFTRKDAPFGDHIAEALRQEDAVIRHPVQRVETEAEKDALWRSVEEYGRGG